MSAPEEAVRNKKRKVPQQPQGLQGGSSEANRFAVVILEVLAGERSPADAAKVLGVTPPRYYQVETRALQGLVAALEPRPKVRQPSAEGRIVRLERSLEEARRECLRYQALLRAAQRNLGIKSPAVTDTKPSGQGAGGRQKRRPMVRALKAARTLAQDTRRPESETVQPGEQCVRQAVSAPEGDGAPPGGLPTALTGTHG